MADRWGIVGGGVLGLTLAHRLSQQGHQVTVFEAGDRIGGLADAWKVGDVEWDRHYHVTLLSDFHLRALLDDLGLEDSLRWSTTRTDFYTGNKFFPLNNALDYMRFPPLGFIEKGRLAATILYAARIENGKRLEKVPLEKWLKSLSGPGTYAKIWQPLLRAKLGDNYKVASASFIWAVIRRLYAARRSGLKTELFGYVAGGYKRIFERFEAVLTGAGVELALNAPVSLVHRDGEEVVVEAGNSAHRFDKVVMTAPSHHISRMCPTLSDAERTALDDTVYQGIVCASVVLKRPLRGCYLTYIADPEIPYTAVVEMSTLVDREEFGGNTLVYLPCYVAVDDPLFEESDEDIEARFLKGLFKMYPDLSEDDVLAFKISRVRRVLAVSTLNYSDSLPPMKTSIPGVYVVNSSQIVNGTLNVNETIMLADEAMETLTGKAVPKPERREATI